MAAAAATAGMGDVGYPIGVGVDAPERQGRLTILFRGILAIPHAIVLYFLAIAQNVVTLIAWFAILFTGKYPDGLYRFSVGVQRWSTRYIGYTFLLTAKYPPFSLDPEEAYPIRLRVDDQTTGRSRLTTLFRIFMVIPHLILLVFLLIAASAVLFVAWLVGIFTASVPPGLHSFLAGTLRWTTRVQGYYHLLTDQYPPFALN